MKLTLRFVLPLLVAFICISWFMAPATRGLMIHWFQEDVELRSQLVFDSIQDGLRAMMREQDMAGMNTLFTRIAQDERLLAVGLCDVGSRLVVKSPSWPGEIACPEPLPQKKSFRTVPLGQGSILIAAFPIPQAAENPGRLVILHDLGYISRRGDSAEIYLVSALTLIGIIAALVTLLVARLTLRSWLTTLKSEVFRGAPEADARKLSPEIAPFVKEMRAALRELERSQAGSEAIRVDWGPDNLRGLLASELPGADVIVISNREPYIHNMVDGKPVVQRPASGLVTALEPIMRACGGTWIAHGSGTADREVVDARDRLQVPPDSPAYTLRRIWLSDEEQNGYYYGLANEGLWPLCHIAFVRPAFREADWEQYVAVNQKFADALVAEAKGPDPIVLIQDYHFALLPKMIRERLPEATIITFWHIPWPNPEVFSICPWKEEILSGLLGSSIIGFHTQFHCLNFLDAADRFLECHIDRENMAIRMGDTVTQVRAYPISIEWPPSAILKQPPVDQCRAHWRRKYNIGDDVALAVGVERFDYTKGIADRFRAVESLLLNHPEWIGRFTLLQIAAPTRGKLEIYRNTRQEADEVSDAINTRFGNRDWRPIVLVSEHQEPDDVFSIFRAGDVCIVSSLHDGMNLVAKEFVAARDDEDGVLILSTFAGASRELREALIVNPYAIREMGEAIHAGLIMPEAERRERMKLMREMVSEFNIYLWAGRMLMDAARIRKRRNLERAIPVPLRIAGG